jgi:hypothetical protein
MLRKGQEGHVRAERDVLKSASLVNSPGGAEWIVRLHYSFQDRDHLYLVSSWQGQSPTRLSYEKKRMLISFDLSFAPAFSRYWSTWAVEIYSTF